MSPSEFLIERFEAILRFEKYFQEHPIIPPTTARSWYRSNTHHRFYEYVIGEQLLEECRLLEKTVPLDDNYWVVGKGSFA